MSSWFPPPSRPIDVEGGIKAQSKRGAIAQTWWSKRFISVLETYGMGSRLSRGRNYARRGQVLKLEINPGSVVASVQGSRRRPYNVRLNVATFGKAEWAAVVEAMVADAWYTAKLLAGEMPEEIEELFESADLSLFPASAHDLTMDCTCPDWEVPCKHIAAVFYLLAEAFDEDPFNILAWRGRERADLLDTLASRRTGTTPVDRLDSAEAVTPLTECLETYFQLPTPLPYPTGHPESSDALCAQLPPTNLTIRQLPLPEALRPTYQALG